MENKSEMVMFVNWIKPPPATPCSARPAMSVPMSFAVAQIIELTKNHATAASNIGLRPQMSDILARMGEAAALASRYAPPIHVYPDAECSWALIVGIAVAVMV